jgi:hypothetical protein
VVARGDQGDRGSPQRARKLGVKPALLATLNSNPNEPGMFNQQKPPQTRRRAAYDKQKFDVLNSSFTENLQLFN